jgi:FMN-dependent NADH-azoreductase
LTPREDGHIDSSILGEASASRQLSAAIVRALTRALPRLEVVRRDLDADPIPHLDSRLLAAVRPDIAADSATRATDEKGAAALKEFVGADIVVIGAPMYNFTIASQLKAWLDRIIIAGKTFRYTEAGAKGLAGGKKVIIASSRGGLYMPGTPQAANDFQETYLRAILGLIGIEDIEIVRAEGLAYGPEQREAAMRAALEAAASVVAGFLPAKAA